MGIRSPKHQDCKKQRRNMDLFFFRKLLTRLVLRVMFLIIHLVAWELAKKSLLNLLINLEVQKIPRYASMNRRAVRKLKQRKITKRQPLLNLQSLPKLTHLLYLIRRSRKRKNLIWKIHNVRLTTRSLVYLLNESPERSKY